MKDFAFARLPPNPRFTVSTQAGPQTPKSATGLTLMEFFVSETAAGVIDIAVKGVAVSILAVMSGQLLHRMRVLRSEHQLSQADQAVLSLAA